MLVIERIECNSWSFSFRTFLDLLKMAILSQCVFLGSLELKENKSLCFWLNQRFSEIYTSLQNLFLFAVCVLFYVIEQCTLSPFANQKIIVL